MATAIDSCVIFDILTDHPDYGPLSMKAVQEAGIKGALVISEPVYAELVSFFDKASQLDSFLSNCEIRTEAVGLDGCREAGRRHARYRKSGGPRTRILTDFLIAGHALASAMSLLTRDDGFYRNHFTGLRIIDPVNLQ